MDRLAKAEIREEQQGLVARAVAGDADAQALLEMLYAQGQGVELNTAEATKWLQKRPIKETRLAERFDRLDKKKRGSKWEL